MTKTIDEVTRDEWSEFVEATIDLLGSARMMYWLDGHDGTEEDQSHADTFRRAETAFVAIGLDQGTTAEFMVRVEHVLKGEIPGQGNIGHA